MAGWVKLHRELIQKPIFQNEKILKVWIWCLCKATHTNHKQIIGRQQITLKPGQFVTGRIAASKELKIPESTVWDYLKLLQSNESINIKSNNKYSIVTVENWALYQLEKDISDSKTDNKWTSNGHQMDTNKNDKNDKKKEYSLSSDFFETIWSMYPEKKGKSKVTKRTKADLEKLGLEKAKAAIDRYRQYVEGKRQNGFPDLQYQHGSTFFNGGINDYLEEENPPDSFKETRLGVVDDIPLDEKLQAKAKRKREDFKKYWEGTE